MTSPLFALFIRSVRQDTRGRVTYAARAILVVVALVFLWPQVIFGNWSGAPGLHFFQSIVQVQAAFITLAGLSYFASAITEEKEEETLGLLRMTDLNPLSILLGKSTSRLAGALQLLAVQLPFTLLAVTLGGITIRQILASYCALGTYVFLLSNLALLASVIARRTSVAATLTCIALISIPIIGIMSSAPSLFDVVPFPRLAEILKTGYAGSIWGRQATFSTGTGVVCFIAAWALFERLCSGRNDTLSTPTGTRGWWRRNYFAPGRTRMPAIVWKDVQFLHGGRIALVVRCFAYAALVGIILWGGVDVSTKSGIYGTLWSLATVLTFTLTLELGFIAGRSLRAEIDGQTLSDLALLPMSMREIVEQKRRACLAVAYPGLFFLVLSAIVVLTLSPFAGDWSLGTIVGGLFLIGIALAYVLSQLVFFVHLVAYLSLRMKRGALPLAIGITWFMVILSFLFFGIGFILLPVAYMAGFAILRDRCIALLDDLSAEN